MSIIARNILNFEYNHTKTMFLRLCKRSHYITTKRCKYLVQCYRHESISATEINDIDSIQTNDSITEHKIIHSMLQKSIFYENTILPPIKASAIVTSEEINELYTIDWSSKSAEYIFNVIRKLTYCYLSGSRFEVSLYNDILDGFITKLSELKDHQIKVLLQCLIALKDVINQTNVYNEFMKALNKQCVRKFFTSNTQELLLISDAFYQLQERYSSFLWRAARKLGSKCYKLTGKELVQLLFLYQGQNLNMFDIECRLVTCLHELTADEVGIIARGFFLSKRSIKNKHLMPMIMKKVSKFISIMDSTNIASVMKLIRYSNCLHCLNEFQCLLQSLHKEIPKLPLQCLTHIAHAIGGIRVYDEILINSILKRVENNLALARLKDIERILYSVCSITPFTAYYTDFCHKLLNEVRSSYKTYRSAEIETYPKVLIRILTFSTIRNIYEPELLQYVFDPKFLQKAYKNNLKLLTSEFLTLHCCVKIDLPQYEGPLLGEKMYTYLTKTYSFNDDIYQKDNNLKVRTEIVFICKNKLGMNVCVDYILPHYPLREIVIGMDKKNNPVEIESILSAMPMGSIKSVNNNNLKEIKWKILLLLTSAVNVTGHNGYIGFIYKKYRQLKTIGYTPIPISEEVWNSYSQEEEKENYLRQLIYEETNLDLKDK